MKAFALAIAVLAVIATGVAAPTPDAVVATDGSGQYKSLQDAISAAPMATDPAGPRWVIFVKPGTYRERVYVQRERGHMLITAEDPATTIVTFDQHALLPGPDGKPISTFRTPTVQIDGDGMIWENLTLANSAGPVAQALALRADGDRLVFRHCRFLGWQDTLLLNRGRHYFVDCYIEGHVDFIFGGATAYFERCHLHALRDGYITAASTPKGVAHGFVFADCKITGVEGAKTYLGRPWREFAKTIFLRTEMSDVVQPQGWDNWKKTRAEQTTFYAEFGSTGPGAQPASRVFWAKPLSAEDVALLGPDQVLAGDDGWHPAHAAAAAKGAAAAPKLRLVLVGDSTVAEGAGWGPGFRRFLRADAECTNTALNGRSSKSFRDEGHWEPALALKGDYYLIQFGHNDQPGKGPSRESDPAVAYPANLTRYVAEVRAIGAQPILVTSLCRRDFKDGKIADTLGPWVEAMKKVAAEKHVPLLDLHAASVAYCEQLGPEKTDALNAKKSDGTPDTTHLSPAGQQAFGQLVARELARLIPNLVLTPFPGPSVPSPSNPANFPPSRQSE